MVIGFLDYFGTGEGRTVLLYSDKDEETIKNKVGEYFSIGMDFFDSEKVCEYIMTDEKDRHDDEMEYLVKSLETHVPIFFRTLIQYDGKVGKLEYSFHYNLV